ncbi:uncharacterized protein [Oryctolagus cuniculus]|uniref:uncharacterized protein isoform X4 n=1 Tax=Oryctolagus cuniculus TaxID=9986 RepID=UPI00387A4E17
MVPCVPRGPVPRLGPSGPPAPGLLLSSLLSGSRAPSAPAPPPALPGPRVPGLCRAGLWGLSGGHSRRRPGLVALMLLYPRHPRTPAVTIAGCSHAAGPPHPRTPAVTAQTPLQPRPALSPGSQVLCTWARPLLPVPAPSPVLSFCSVAVGDPDGRPVVALSRRSDVLVLTPWLAPIVWEGTFSPEILDEQFRLQNVTVGLTVFAVKKYVAFLRLFLETAEQHFMVGHRVTYYVFTNRPADVPHVPLREGRRLAVLTVRSHARWQDVSMHRMEVISRFSEQRFRREVDYLVCADVDMKFRDHVGVEILSRLFGTLHPGFYRADRRAFAYERRPRSQAYIPPDEGDFYYMGALFGGSVAEVQRLASACHQATVLDKANGIEAVWHDESHLNRPRRDPPNTSGRPVVNETLRSRHKKQGFQKHTRRSRGWCRGTAGRAAARAASVHAGRQSESRLLRSWPSSLLMHPGKQQRRPWVPAPTWETQMEPRAPEREREREREREVFHPLVHSPNGHEGQN